MEEYEAKCTRENYLFMRVLEAILARIPNVEVLLAAMCEAEIHENGGYLRDP